MSEVIIKKEIRKYIRSSGLEVSTKMICPIVKLFNMKYEDIDSRQVAFLTNKIIKEIR